MAWTQVAFVAWAVIGAVVHVQWGVGWMTAWLIGMPAVLYALAWIADATKVRRRK